MSHSFCANRESNVAPCTPLQLYYHCHWTQLGHALLEPARSTCRRPPTVLSATFYRPALVFENLPLPRA